MLSTLRDAVGNQQQKGKSAESSSHPRTVLQVCRRGRNSWEDTHGRCFHSFSKKMESPLTAVSASSSLVCQDIVDSSTPTGVFV